MTATEIIRESESLPLPDKLSVIRHWAETMKPGRGESRKAVERLLRRLENPDVPEDVWRGIEDAEDGRVVDLEAALTQKPPWLP